MMWKEPDTDPVEYRDEFEVPDEWEEMRNEDGEVVPGCYRTKPTSTDDL